MSLLPQMIIYLTPGAVATGVRVTTDVLGQPTVVIEGDVPTAADQLPADLIRLATRFTFIIPVLPNQLVGFHWRDLPKGVSSTEYTGHLVIVRGTSYDAVAQQGRFALNSVRDSFRQ